MKIAKRVIIATVLPVGIIFYLFYPFHMQPVRIAIENESTYIFDITSSGYTKIGLSRDKRLDLSGENIFSNLIESKTMIMIGADRRFINRYAKKTLANEL